MAPAPSGTPPSPFSEIDGVIGRWLERHSLTLCREWQGEARFWYTSRGEECFQVSVERPIGGSVVVHAWSVNTDDDAELHGKWSVDVTGLGRALATATEVIDLWAGRARLSG